MYNTSPQSAKGIDDPCMYMCFAPHYRESSVAEQSHVQQLNKGLIIPPDDESHNYTIVVIVLHMYLWVGVGVQGLALSNITGPPMLVHLQLGTFATCLQSVVVIS